MDANSEARQVMWRLAHAHGTLLALLHIAFAATARLSPGWGERRQRAASRLLLAASWLLPGGFFLGGAAIQGGDPGLGVLVVPLGAALLFAAVLVTAWSLSAARRSAGDETGSMR